MVIITNILLKLLVGVILVLYVYATLKLVTLWFANSNKRRVLFYELVLTLYTAALCYTIHERHYGILTFLLIILINSLYIAYINTKK